MSSTDEVVSPVTARPDEDDAAIDDPAALAARVLVEEEARRRPETSGDGRAFDVEDEDAPLGEVEEMRLSGVVAAGGASTLGITVGLNLVDEFSTTAVQVLAPDIQDSLGISDAVIAATATIGGIFVVASTLPIGYLADRMRRTRVIAGISVVLAAFMALTGVVQNAVQLAGARIGAGIGKGGGPAHKSLLADAYPISGRARVYGLFEMANPVGLLLGPLLAGGIAALAGGDEGWRWAFVVLAVPVVVLAIGALRLPDPERGRNERTLVLGDGAGGVHPLGPADPVPVSAAFARLRTIRSFYLFLTGFAIVGFALFGFFIFFSLFLEEEYGLEAFDRGVVISLASIGGILGAVVAGRVADRSFRSDPARAVRIAALFMLGFLANAVAVQMPVLPLVVLFAAVGYAGMTGTLTMLNAVIAAVVPGRMRAQGFAMVGVYLFFFGAFLGAVIVGNLSESLGEKTALTLAVPPPVILGAAVIHRAARHVRADMAQVGAELREEQRAARAAADGDVPVVQVRDLDVSYGSLQVLFDVDLDVHRGEVLALLGTNGAGKSTLLKAISGLVPADRGVVRLNGRTITFTDAEERVRRGIVQVPGGKAVFPGLTVEENLRAGAFSFFRDRSRYEAKRAEVLELFPVLRERIDQPAGTLSGGQQQMLAIAKGLLLDPEILAVDELSLGLAPVVVQQLIEVVERLKAAGTTMIIVEQSVNVALSVADRAVFMEKGRIRFSGPAAELLERDDLVRAVFLGGGEG